MRRWKWILMMLVLTSIIASISVHPISAYLADMDMVNNSIVVGGNRISIEEDYEPKPIVPGAVIKKKVRICNDGPNKCYVRVRAVFSDSDVGNYTAVDWNTSDWTYNSEEEFYYYKKPIAEGEYTSCLMNQIKIHSDIPEHCVKDTELIIYAESYQADGFADYREAWKDYQLNIK